MSLRIRVVDIDASDEAASEGIKAVMQVVAHTLAGSPPAITGRTVAEHPAKVAEIVEAARPALPSAPPSPGPTLPEPRRGRPRNATRGRRAAKAGRVTQEAAPAARASRSTQTPHADRNDLTVASALAALHEAGPLGTGDIAKRIDMPRHKAKVLLEGMAQRQLVESTGATSGQRWHLVKKQTKAAASSRSSSKEEPQGAGLKGQG